MKLYTRTGDDGTTRLFGNQLVDKDHPRITACGEVDELNCSIGLARAACGSAGGHNELDDMLAHVQNTLFDVGADLATPRDVKGESKVRRITGADAAALEPWIDRICEKLPPMKEFILPAGTELSARLHTTRAICRRAERACVRLARIESGIGHVVSYLNRLSDLLFAAARWANALACVDDVPWRKQPE